MCALGLVCSVLTDPVVEPLDSATKIAAHSWWRNWSQVELDLPTSACLAPGVRRLCIRPAFAATPQHSHSASVFYADITRCGRRPAGHSTPGAGHESALQPHTDSALILAISYSASVFFADSISCGRRPAGHSPPGAGHEAAGHAAAGCGIHSRRVGCRGPPQHTGD